MLLPVVLEGPRRAKVQQNWPPIRRDDDVIRADVTMDNAELMYR